MCETRTVFPAPTSQTLVGKVLGDAMTFGGQAICLCRDDCGCELSSDDACPSHNSADGAGGALVGGLHGPLKGGLFSSNADGSRQDLSRLGVLTPRNFFGDDVFSGSEGSQARGACRGVVRAPRLRGGGVGCVDVGASCIDGRKVFGKSTGFALTVFKTPRSLRGVCTIPILLLGFHLNLTGQKKRDRTSTDT